MIHILFKHVTCLFSIHDLHFLLHEEHFYQIRYVYLWSLLWIFSVKQWPFFQIHDIFFQINDEHLFSKDTTFSKSWRTFSKYGMNIFKYVVNFYFQYMVNIFLVFHIFLTYSRNLIPSQICEVIFSQKDSLHNLVHGPGPLVPRTGVFHPILHLRPVVGGTAMSRLLRDGCRNSYVSPFSSKRKKAMCPNTNF